MKNIEKFFEEFKKGDTCVICRNQEEAENFVNKCYDNGITWKDKTCTETHFGIWDNFIIYQYENGNLVYSPYNCDVEGAIEWCQYMNGFTIVEDSKNNKEDKFKDFFIKFKKERTNVICRTLEEAQNFVKKCYEYGIEWRTDCIDENRTFFEKCTHFISYICENGYLLYGADEIIDMVDIVEWSGYMSENPTLKETSTSPIKEFQKIYDEVKPNEEPTQPIDLLKDGMIVEFRNGDRRLKINDKLLGDDYVDLSYFDNDLKSQEDEVFDIMRIYKSCASSIGEILDCDCLEIFWQREEEDEPEEPQIVDLTEVSTEDLLAEIQRRLNGGVRNDL